ncbi:recombinase family protein [Mesorhizobium waimense]|uniref:recombinase family protein n=1 Tax=Mesorhizobium waimense TaxID=1300307 RepID=UPI001FE08A80|nr:recombinase family protein [Mesorhizobium waimense]
MPDNSSPFSAPQDEVDLFDYVRKPRAPRHATSQVLARTAIDRAWDLSISDDWPDRIPVSDAELDVFEVHFGPLLDELLSDAKGISVVAEFVEAGASATDDRRPEFQRMMDAGAQKPAPFKFIIVHSFSRFFRDQFQLEFYVRRLAKNGIRLTSTTQDLGDDPMSVMMRQIMALFDEYQSKENAKHTLRAMPENARQGYWNGSRAPFGYRIVAAGQRGSRTKKKIEPDPARVDTVRLMFRLARVGADNGPMGARQIADFLNIRGIRTQTGGRWGVGAVHQIFTRETYIGRHRFNVSSWRKKQQNPDDQVVEVIVEPIVDPEEFAEVQ